MKQCRTCKEIKNEEEYYNQGQRKGKLRESKNTECKLCARLRTKKNSTKEYRRLNNIKHKYNILKEEYAILLEKYPVCDICKFPFKENDICIDHCHTTGKIRGLLCSNCNFGLGRFKDNILFLNSAIAYLNKFQ